MLGNPGLWIMIVVAIIVVIIVIFRKKLIALFQTDKTPGFDERARTLELLAATPKYDANWKNEWPSPARLYSFIETKIHPQHRKSRLAILNQVHKRYGLELEKTKEMLAYYRGTVLSTVLRQVGKEKNKFLRQNVKKKK